MSKLGLANMWVRSDSGPNDPVQVNSPNHMCNPISFDSTADLGDLAVSGLDGLEDGLGRVGPNFVRMKRAQ